MAASIALVRLFVAAVRGEAEVVESSALRAVRDSGLASCQEALRLVHLFAGFPRNLTALEAWERGLRGRARRTPNAKETPRRRPSAGAGRALFDRIYAQHARAVRARLAELDPCVARWIEQHAYGSVLSQCDALEAADVECLAVAALIATNQERQLISHILGAVRCGATPRAIRTAASAGAERIPPASRKQLLGRVEATLAGLPPRAAERSHPASR